MNDHGKDAGLFAPHLILQPSRLFALLLLVLAIAATSATFASHLSLVFKAPLLIVVLACLLRAWWQEKKQTGLRELRIENQDANTFVLRFANGNTRTAQYAGHALLGTWVVFVYVTRSGWRCVFGAQRIAVVCDAVDADSYRRLRAWVRLA